jgi:hypothetical protein
LRWSNFEGLEIKKGGIFIWGEEWAFHPFSSIFVVGGYHTTKRGKRALLSGPSTFKFAPVD